MKNLSSKVIAFFVISTICGGNATKAMAAVEVELPSSINDNGEYFMFDGESRNEAAVKYVDLTGDRIDEAAVQMAGRRGPGESSLSFTMIFELHNGVYERVWTYIGGERSGGLELLDVDSDTVADLVAWDQSGTHYTSITVVSWKNREYARVFENGTPCSVLELGNDQAGPVVTIGREDWENPDFCYANSDRLSRVELWRWKNGRFEFDPQSSTAPFRSEAGALEVTVSHMLATTGKQYSDPEELSQDKLLSSLWVAGFRAVLLGAGEGF